MQKVAVRFGSAFALVLLVIGSVGCSSRSPGQTGDRAASAVLLTSGRAQSSRGASDNTDGIIQYGPHDIQAGVAFNEQPSGESAVWVHMSRSLEGSDAVIKIDGAPMKSSIDGTAITALVPSALYRSPATLQLTVEQHQDGKLLRSGPVPVHVH